MTHTPQRRVRGIKDVIVSRRKMPLRYRNDGTKWVIPSRPDVKEKPGRGIDSRLPIVSRDRR